MVVEFKKLRAGGVDTGLNAQHPTEQSSPIHPTLHLHLNGAVHVPLCTARPMELATSWDDIQLKRRRFMAVVDDMASLVVGEMSPPWRPH
jgi:hypothetical protein